MNHADAPIELAAGALRVDALALKGSVRGASAEWVAEEEPIAIEVNGIAHAVMLATPTCLGDFALGFLLSEGLIDAPGDLLDVECAPRAPGVVLQLQVTQRCLHRFKQARRSLAGRTGCGLCGTESMEHALRPVTRPVADLRVTAASLQRAMDELAGAQQLQRATGATHAAAWCGIDGALHFLREDVGRHNALDKLIGAMARQGTDAAQGFIAVTSRASYEMVHKTASAGVGLLAAISAPTTLAITTARDAGVTLAGFVRGVHAVLYTGAERVLP